MRPIIITDSYISILNQSEHFNCFQFSEVSENVSVLIHYSPAPTSFCASVYFQKQLQIFSELIGITFFYVLATLIIMSKLLSGMNKFFSQSTNDISTKRKPAAQRYNSSLFKLESGNSKSFNYKKLNPLSSLKEVSSKKGFATPPRNQSFAERVLLLNNEPELGYDFCEDIHQVDEASVADENVFQQTMAEEDTPRGNPTVIHDSEPKVINVSPMVEAETRQERKMLAPGTAMQIRFKAAPDLKHELQKFQFKRKTITETPESDKALQEETAIEKVRHDVSKTNADILKDDCNNVRTHPPVPKPRNNRQQPPVPEPIKNRQKPPQPLPRKLKCFEWKAGGRSCNNNEEAQKHETSFTRKVFEHSPTTQVRSVSQIHREIACFGEGVTR